MTSSPILSSLQSSTAIAEPAVIQRGSRAAASSAPETAAKSAPAADQASLSQGSAAIAQALTVSDARLDKVAALRESISAGTYNVSSSDVADKLIHSLLA